MQTADLIIDAEGLLSHAVTLTDTNTRRDARRQLALDALTFTAMTHRGLVAMNLGKEGVRITEEMVIRVVEQLAGVYLIITHALIALLI